jgi:predicted nucleotidyltransferase
MASIVARLVKANLIQPPVAVVSNTVYETIMGSYAFGVSNDMSDTDLYGFCIPEKEVIFPHLAGEIPGFGRQIQRFEQYQQHHVKEASSGREYDITIYNIVKYFQLCMDNNPNMLDSLFTPRRCVTHSTHIAEMVREKRRMFLHKGAFHKLKGYAFGQLSKLDNGSNRSNPKRAASMEKYGFDVKFAYHVIRLMSQAEQILIEGDLDLEEKGRREQMKSVRNGEWTMDQIKEWFHQKELSLEKLYAESKLRHGPDQEAIKQLLIDCLEHHYGSLQSAGLVIPTNGQKLLNDLKELVVKYDMRIPEELVKLET